MYLVAGAGYGLLLVYLILVIHLEKTLPLLDNGQDPGKDALATSIIVVGMDTGARTTVTLNVTKVAGDTTAADTAKFS